MSSISATAVDKLLNRLPSFYQEHNYDQTFLENLFAAYSDVTSTLYKQAESVYYNNEVSTAELYRRLDNVVLELSTGLYFTPTVAIEFNKQSDVVWEDATIAQKVAYLDTVGLYESLDARRVQDGSKPCEIISVTIAKDFIGLLGDYVNLEDYVLLNNKLYLFNDLCRDNNLTKKGPKRILLREVFVDYSKLENAWGVLYPWVTPYMISRPEYKEFVKDSLTLRYSISSMQQALSHLTGGAQNRVKMYDKYSRDDVDVNDLPQLADLDPFDFIIMFPNTTAGYSSSDPATKLREANVKYLLDLIKPAYTNYQLLWSFDDPYDPLHRKGWRDTYTVTSDDKETNLVFPEWTTYSMGRVLETLVGFKTNVSRLNDPTQVLCGGSMFQPDFLGFSIAGGSSPQDSEEDRFPAVVSEYTTHIVLE